VAYAIYKWRYLVYTQSMKGNEMNNDYEHLVRYLMTRKGYSKSKARGEAWKCIVKKALIKERKNELLS